MSTQPLNPPNSGRGPLNVLVDANNLLYRAYHTTGNLTLADGTPCGGAWGFLRNLLLNLGKIITHNKVNSVHVVWDAARSPRRMEMWPSYKAKRRKEKEPGEEILNQREEMYKQADLLNDALLMAGFYVYKAPGVECDDIIAFLVDALEPERVAIYSEDSDFDQLMGDRVVRLRGKGELETGCSCSLFDKCILGDPTDDIPGVGGLGKAALANIRRFLRESFGLPNPGVDEALEALFSKKTAELADRKLQGLILKLMEGLPEFHRARQMMDLSISKNWPEVIQAGLDAAVQVPDPDKFEKLCMKRGWHGLSPYFRVIRKLSEVQK